MDRLPIHSVSGSAPLSSGSNPRSLQRHTVRDGVPLNDVNTTLHGRPTFSLMDPHNSGRLSSTQASAFSQPTSASLQGLFSGTIEQSIEATEHTRQGIPIPNGADIVGCLPHSTLRHDESTFSMFLQVCSLVLPERTQVQAGRGSVRRDIAG
jgi:hypothetical protein